MMDKQKQIEEIHKMAQIALGKQVDIECTKWAIEEGLFDNFVALCNAGYRKIPEGAVVIPKEISCYENIEKRVRSFRLDGKKVDFTPEQIMALTQILHFKERNEKEIRKETAEKFAEKLKEKKFDEYSPEGKCYECVAVSDIDETCKEFTEGKYGESLCEE